MPDQSDLTRALAALEESGFAPNARWAVAHEIAQAHEGEPVFDAMHALCHRIEGDEGNARYWDRRAGTAFGGDGHAAEFAALKAFAEGKN
ncbi:MAG: hypothetical protein AAFY06_02490 [Pseudomonadota bacterium]